jgi:dihydroneopterin aldolase
MSDSTMTIQLNNVHFFGYHGLYKEERIIGNNFIVNLYIKYTPNKNRITAIQETIDYVKVYDLVKNRMQTPTPLLETIIDDIINTIFLQFPIAQKVNVQITKEKIYVDNINGNMSVSLTKTRS